MTSDESTTGMFISRFGRTLPRGELWLGTEALARAGLRDNVENHLRLADQLAHDVVCFSVAMATELKPALGYRYFTCAELGSAVKSGNQMVAAVVDGPFQELVNTMGLTRVATDWFRQREALLSAYAVKQTHALELIQRCLDQGARLVVIADDLAAQQGPLFKPADLETLCGDFYARAAQRIHAARARLFWHCCGNITSLIPLVKAWRLDGLAAVQHQTNNLVALSEALGHRLAIMAGIDNELLDADMPPSEAVDGLKQIVSALAPTGCLILGSSCGLYRGAYLSRIKKIYRMTDQWLAMD